MPNNKVFTDYDEFKKEVGLIDDLAELKRINAPVPEHENGMYETIRSQTEPLQKFLEANPEYHLATVTSDGDGTESDEHEKIWFEQNPDKKAEDFEDFSENEILWEKFQEDFPVCVFTIDNQVRRVNRMGYFLCRGNKDNGIYLCEVERGESANGHCSGLLHADCASKACVCVCHRKAEDLTFVEVAQSNERGQHCSSYAKAFYGEEIPLSNYAYGWIITKEQFQTKDGFHRSLSDNAKSYVAANPL